MVHPDMDKYGIGRVEDILEYIYWKMIEWIKHL